MSQYRSSCSVARCSVQFTVTQTVLFLTLFTSVGIVSYKKLASF